MLAPSWHQDDPFLLGVHNIRCVGISVGELSSYYVIRYHYFLSTWSFCHSSRTLQTNSSSFCWLWWLSGCAQCEGLLSALSQYPPLLLDCSLLVMVCLPDGAPHRHQSGPSTKLSPHLTISALHRLRHASCHELPSQYNYPCSSWSRQVSWKDCQHSCSACLVCTIFSKFTSSPTHLNTVPFSLADINT